MATRRHTRMHKHKHSRKCMHCSRKVRTSKRMCSKCAMKRTRKHRRMRGG